MRALGFAVLVSLSASVVLIGIAMALYPGGTWHDPKHPGHHFFYNFLCDLLRRNALDGRPNFAGAQFATLGMLALSLALGMFFWFLPEAMRHWPVAGTVVRLTGVLAALGLAGVTLMPSDRFGYLHTLAILAAVGPGIVAATLGMAGVIFGPEASGWHRSLGLLLWLGLLLTTAIFVRHTFFGGGLVRLLATLQRLTALAAVGWIAATVIRVLRLWAAGQR